MPSIRAPRPARARRRGAGHGFLRCGAPGLRRAASPRMDAAATGARGAPGPALPSSRRRILPLPPVSRLLASTALSLLLLSILPHFPLLLHTACAPRQSDHRLPICSEDLLHRPPLLRSGAPWPTSSPSPPRAARGSGAEARGGTPRRAVDRGGGTAGKHAFRTWAGGPVVVGTTRIERVAPRLEAAVAFAGSTPGMAAMGGNGTVPSPFQLPAAGILTVKVN
jgi:hypothetical protein